MDFLSKNAGVVALIAMVIAIGAYWYPKLGVSGFGSSTSCSGITCLSGGLRLVSDAGGDFESDVAAVFASTVNITGALTAAAISGTSGSFTTTLGVTGVTALNSSLSVVATTTAATVAIGSSTPSSFTGNVLIVHNTSGTSTISVASTVGTKGGCIQLEAPGGGYLSLFATSTGVVAVWQSGACQ